MMNHSKNKHTGSTHTENDRPDNNERKPDMDQRETAPNAESETAETPKDGKQAGFKAECKGAKVEAGGPDPDGSTTKTVLTILATGAAVTCAVAVTLAITLAEVGKLAKG